MTTSVCIYTNIKCTRVTEKENEKEKTHTSSLARFLFSCLAIGAWLLRFLKGTFHVLCFLFLASTYCWIGEPVGQPQEMLVEIEGEVVVRAVAALFVGRAQLAWVLGRLVVVLEIGGQYSGGSKLVEF